MVQLRNSTRIYQVYIKHISTIIQIHNKHGTKELIKYITEIYHIYIKDNAAINKYIDMGCYQ